MRSLVLINGMKSCGCSFEISDYSFKLSYSASEERGKCSQNLCEKSKGFSLHVGLTAILDLKIKSWSSFKLSLKCLSNIFLIVFTRSFVWEIRMKEISWVWLYNDPWFEWGVRGKERWVFMYWCTYAWTELSKIPLNKFSCQKKKKKTRILYCFRSNLIP